LNLEVLFHLVPSSSILANQKARDLKSTFQQDREREPRPEKRSQKIFNAAIDSKLSVIYPGKLTPPSEEPGRFVQADILHLSWKAQNVLEKGITDDWMKRIQNLTFIPINKNAHSAIMAAFGELAKRLGAGNVTIFSRYNKRYNATELLASSAIILTVLRDPVERFISATCEDLRQRGGGLECFGTDNVEESLDCELKYLHGRTPSFTHHQTPQHDQLAVVMQELEHVPVSVIPFTQVNQLIRELGGNVTVKSRDRTDASYLGRNTMGNGLQSRIRKAPRRRLSLLSLLFTNERKSKRKGRNFAMEQIQQREQSLKRLTRFCSLTASDLKTRHLRSICSIYQRDVELVERTGLPVPLCSSRRIQSNLVQ
jgi:hypothetical protein